VPPDARSDVDDRIHRRPRVNVREHRIADTVRDGLAEHDAFALSWLPNVAGFVAQIRVDGRRFYRSFDDGPEAALVNRMLRWCLEAGVPGERAAMRDG
jgi:hypothetical protein